MGELGGETENRGTSIADVMQVSVGVEHGFHDLPT